MKILNIKVEDIKPYEQNPRINNHAVEKVANSIKEFGIKQPLVVDENNVLIVGHTRLKAMQQLGIKEAPCIVASDLTPEQAKAYRLVDNKTNEFADWDFELLDLELNDLALDFDMSSFGFDGALPEIDIDGIFEEHIDEYKVSDDTNYLVWGDKKVEVDDNDIKYLDNKYYEWESLSTGINFVSWLGDNT